MQADALTKQQEQYWLLLAELEQQALLADAGKGDLARVLEINNDLNKIARGD